MFFKFSIKGNKYYFRPVPLVFVSSNKHHQESRPLSVINITREAKNPEEVSAVLRPTSTCLQPSSSEISISPSLAAWRAYQESRKNVTASNLSMNTTAKPPRSAMINYGNVGSFSPSSRFGSNNKWETEKPLESTVDSKPTLGKPAMTSIPIQITPGKRSHEVEISSDDVENGLKLLLEKVQEVYGGRGKVKKRKNAKFSVKFIGPESVAKMLNTVLKSIEDLQRKGNEWKFCQKIEESIYEQSLQNNRKRCFHKTAQLYISTS